MKQPFKELLHDRQFILGTLLFATSCGLALAFSLMWFQDTVKVCEPNLFIRTLELLMALGMGIYGLYCLISQIRKVGK